MNFFLTRDVGIQKEIAFVQSDGNGKFATLFDRQVNKLSNKVLLVTPLFKMNKLDALYNTKFKTIIT